MSDLQTTRRDDASLAGDDRFEASGTPPPHAGAPGDAAHLLPPPEVREGVPLPVAVVNGARSSTKVKVLAGLLAAAALGLGALYAMTKSDLSSANAALSTTKSELAATKGELAAISADRDQLQAADDARIAEQNALPDVASVVRSAIGARSGFDIQGDATYAEISVTGVGLYDISSLEDALADLGFPASIGAQIGNTRALDGTLTATGKHVTASWTYHPDDGLSLVLTRTD